jgi:hypothetical protein
VLLSGLLQCFQAGDRHELEPGCAVLRRDGRYALAEAVGAAGDFGLKAAALEPNPYRKDRL